MTPEDIADAPIAITFDREGQLVDFEGSLAAWFSLVATHQHIANSEMVRCVESLSMKFHPEEEDGATPPCDTEAGDP